MEDEIGRACSKNGEKTNAYSILVGKPERKKPLGRLWRRWVGDIKMDRREIRWDGMDWIDVAQNRDQGRALVNMIINLCKDTIRNSNCQDPYCVICSEYSDHVSVLKNRNYVHYEIKRANSGIFLIVQKHNLLSKTLKINI
jgi:hypothetical protein